MKLYTGHEYRIGKNTGREISSLQERGGLFLVRLQVEVS
jgi:hypothetical protein